MNCSGNFDWLEDYNKKIDYSFELEAQDYTSSSSKRIFVPVNKLEQDRFYVPDEESRLTDIRLPYQISERDSIIFNFPEGYVVESTPDDVQLENPFGSYSAVLHLKNDKAVYIRSLSFTKQEISKEFYKKFTDFISAVNKHDDNQFVLVKEEED